MLTRALFAKSLAALAAATAAPSPGPSPSHWDLCDKNPALPYDRPLEIKMRVLDGPDFDLMSYRGHPTMLHIFTTWCEPCAIEMPNIVAAAKAYAGSGLKVVGIDVRESDNAVRAYRKRFDIPFPIAMDENGGFARNLESGGRAASRFPVSLYITASGYLYCYTIGTSEHPQRELTYRIEKFLKEGAQ